MRAGELARGVGQVLVAWPRFVAAPLYRRWHLRWGATDEVWPWLVQLGSGRAGWYSYDLFDNDGRPSADRILPQLQQIQVGDWVPMSGTVNETTAFKVNGFEPHRRHGTLRRRGRRRVAIVAATVGVIAVSQWLGRTAGSTQAERRQPLPGDELIDHPTVVTNHAATIPVPPDQVWPWLVQMGWHRGGWYTPRFIDRLLFPGNWPSATQLVPELQCPLQVGDRIPDGPPGTAWFVVERVDPPKLLVLHSTTHLPGSWRARWGAAIDWSWTFTLVGSGDGGTRLLLRVRGRTRPRWLTATYVAALIPADYVMAPGMLAGIRRRATPSTGWRCRVGVLDEQTNTARPRGCLRDLRPGRVAVQAARPGRRSGTRAGDASREDTMTAALAESKIVPPAHGALGVGGLALKARVRGILNRHPAVGLAVGVVRNGRLEFFYGHGLADIASNTPVSEDTVFRIGSITKTFTAIAVLQLWEQGLVDLDVPANDYLRAYRLVPAKAAHRPATVRQLLTHTAGLPQLVYPSRAFRPILGETVRFGQRLPTLAEFYRGGLHLVAEPGTRHTYSNHGFATLGQIVEDVSGEPLDRYFREHIFEPLGMADTDLLRSDRVRSRLATGYALRSDGPHPVSDCDVVTVGAGSIYSTTKDMARYVSALLGGGANEHGSVLKPETLASMFAPHYQPDPRLPGVGLAFFRGEVGGHLVVEHDGLVPGFSSQMSVAPDDGVGVVAFTNGARSAKAWLGAEVAGTMSNLLGVADDAIRTDVPHHPEIWRDICGRYSFYGSFRDVQKWFVTGAEVSVHRGQLMLHVLSPIPALNRRLPLHPDDHQDPYVFRIDLSTFGIGTSRVVFSRAPGVGTTAVHLGVAPLSFQRQQPRTRNPRWRATAALGALAAATTATAARRRRRRR